MKRIVIVPDQEDRLRRFMRLGQLQAFIDECKAAGADDDLPIRCTELRAEWPEDHCGHYDVRSTCVYCYSAPVIVP